MFRWMVSGAIIALSAIAWIAVAPEQAHAGAEAYKANCVKCHAREARVVRSLKGNTPEDKAAELDKFLATHYAEDEAVRKRIVEYLVGFVKS